MAFRVLTRPRKKIASMLGIQRIQLATLFGKAESWSNKQLRLKLLELDSFVLCNKHSDNTGNIQRFDTSICLRGCFVNRIGLD